MKPALLSQLARRTEAPPISWLMGLTLARPNLISLAAGFTDNDSLPVTVTRELVDQVLRNGKSGRPALQYGSTAGDPVLRKLTARDLCRLDGPSAVAPERLVITNGSQQLLYMVAEALCDTGDLVLVEDPSYFVFLGILQSRGLRGRGVHMESDGIDLGHLTTVLERLKKSGEIRRLKMLYLVSYFQNPTGITTSLEKKAALLDLLRHYEPAAGHRLYLLEDAAYRELRFRGGDVRSSLAVPGHANRVIYAGTYSKPFATGMRVGFGVLPEPVLSAVTRIKGNHDFGTSNLLQQVLARAIATGAYADHLQVLRRRYARKASVMLTAMNRYFPPEVTWPETRGGLYYWARLPASLHSGANSRLFKAAIARDILYVPGQLCYAADPARPRPDHEMRLSFGGVKLDQIQAGIERLGSALKKDLKLET